MGATYTRQSSSGIVDGGVIEASDLNNEFDQLLAAFVASTGHKYRPTRDTWGPLVVPYGRYFVLGDNRENSEDSRYWGFVERDQLRGQPWLVYYSFVPSSAVNFPSLRRVRWARLGTFVD